MSMVTAFVWPYHPGLVFLCVLLGAAVCQALLKAKQSRLRYVLPVLAAVIIITAFLTPLLFQPPRGSSWLFDCDVIGFIALPGLAMATGAGLGNVVGFFWNFFRE